MQLTTLFVYAAALISTALAMPHIAGPYHGAHIPYRLQTNTTSAHNATTTGTGPKAPLTTGTASNGTHAPVVHHAMDHVNVNHCHELCSLQSQTCSLAVPDDDKFCWSVYKGCTEKCHEENFRRI